MSLESESIKAQLESVGYVVVPDLIPPHLDLPLNEACLRAAERTRIGNWPHRRIVGKQFPPFEGDETDVWGVQHLMHPELGEPVFAEWYGSQRLREVCCELLDCQPENLQMELFNLLVNPSQKPFALRWHRDDIPTSVDRTEELARLEISSFGVQWNTALLPDSSLYVVPGTHKVALTPPQRALCTPFAPKNPLDMPGAIKVSLQPGETVFYNNNILHCATYDNSIPRMTLHACMGDTRGGENRARNILQHDLRWIKTPHMARMLEVLDQKDGGIRSQMVQRLIQLADATAGEDGSRSLGYSLEG
ncbi:hypothetical protein M407DRAFT_234400 [Tulasnella calospora MUT 4182]|uniref:Phytanoyl-CoA dioxygenase n=1 Tax=Tulasnella calospora MUT 4182 TaxID=1051891 RepID=A0A0C3MHT8_9AGAM|nr:hypothetical protein M407DRAFT_234400 [Tulasnella calospora MUT 4182]